MVHSSGALAGGLDALSSTTTRSVAGSSVNDGPRQTSSPGLIFPVKGKMPSAKAGVATASVSGKASRNVTRTLRRLVVKMVWDIGASQCAAKIRTWEGRDP